MYIYVGIFVCACRLPTVTTRFAVAYDAHSLHNYMCAALRVYKVGEVATAAAEVEFPPH